MNAVNEEADSWAEVLNRLRRAQGQLAAVIAMIEAGAIARTSSPNWPRPPTHWTAPASR
jgi:hypothetical protein